jgi:hypothetical protein
MRRVTLLAIAMFLAACSSTPSGPAGEASEQRARISAYHRVHPQASFTLAFVPSSPFGNAASQALLGSRADTAASRQLSDQIRRDPPADILVVVTGPDDQLAANTLIDALSRIPPGAVEHVHVVYIGAPGNEVKLNSAVARVGIQIEYINYP